MPTQTYRVYVQVDTDNNIIAINSSAFVDENWGIKIDEGLTNKFHHAQNNYFNKPIITIQGVYRYKLIDGVVIEKSDEEITSEESIIISLINKQNRIKELKQMLFDTDYVVIKIAEGVATTEDYADVIARRQVWREEINQLELELA